MTQLIELPATKRRLKLIHDEDDETLLAVIEQASEIVIDALETAYVYDSETPVPLLVQALTFEVVRSLYDDPEADPLTKSAKRIMGLIRDPAMA